MRCRPIETMDIFFGSLAKAFFNDQRAVVAARSNFVRDQTANAQYQFFQFYSPPGNIKIVKRGSTCPGSFKKPCYLGTNSLQPISRNGQHRRKSCLRAAAFGIRSLDYDLNHSLERPKRIFSNV